MIEDSIIASSCNDNIVMNWVDATPYDDIVNMPYTYNKMQEGVYYNKMYTQTSYTHPTYKLVFGGLNLIEDKNFLYLEDDIFDSEFFGILEKEGYEFSSVGWYHLIHQNRYKNCYKRATSYDIPSSLTLFDMATEMEMKEHTFILSHIALREIHSPFMSIDYPASNGDGFGTSIPEKLKNDAILASEKYIDNQLEFYSKWMDKSRFTIFMSDHGGERHGEESWIEDYYHTIFAITGESVPCKTINKLTSLRRFTDIVGSVIKDGDKAFEKIDIYSDGYALIEEEDRYNRVDILLEKRTCDPLDFQRRGLITEEDVLIRSVTGDEYYYRDGSTKVNHIDDDEFTDKIQQRREQLGKVYIDIYTYNRYKNSRRVYRKLHIYRSSDNIYV